MLENIAFFLTKREKIVWLSTLKVGGGENLLVVPTPLSEIVCKKNLKNVTPLALTKAGEEGGCTILRVQLTSAAKKKQHAMASLTWVGTKNCRVIFLNYLFQ